MDKISQLPSKKNLEGAITPSLWRGFSHLSKESGEKPYMVSWYLRLILFFLKDKIFDKILIHGIIEVIFKLKNTYD